MVHTKKKMLVHTCRHPFQFVHNLEGKRGEENLFSLPPTSLAVFFLSGLEVVGVVGGHFGQAINHSPDTSPGCPLPRGHFPSSSVLSSRCLDPPPSLSFVEVHFSVSEGGN